MVGDDLKKYLTYISENSSHWVYRCPFCGDSRNEKHGHLYVHKTSPVFRCARCGYAGHYKSLFEAIDADDIIIPENILKGSTSKKYGSKKRITFANFKNHEQSICEYFKQRLGMDYIPEELNVVTFETYKKLCPNDDLFFKNNVSFLTARHRKMVTRVLNDKNFRYYNYSLMEGPDWYVINNTPRRYVEYRQHNTLVIAEGIFDIINQYVNRFVPVPDDSVFAASITHNHMASIRMLRGYTFSYKPNIIILADNDTKDDFYLKGLDYSSIKIYRNVRGKDFGELKVKATLSYSK